MSEDQPGQPKRVQRTELLDTLNLGLGKVRLERRRGEKFIYARAFLQGKYVGKIDRRRGQQRALHGKTFEECATAFLDYADSTLKNEVSEGQRRNYRDNWNLLKRYFDSVRVAEPPRPRQL